jgi:hypothetical protein
MDPDARSTARTSVPTLAPPLPARTTSRELFIAAVIGVVFVAGTTMALVGFPSLRSASEARNTSVARSTQSDALAQPAQAATAAHVTTPVRQIVAPERAPKGGVEKPKPAPINKSSAAEYVPSPAPSATVAPMVGPPAPDTIASERGTRASAIAAPEGGATEAVTISGCLEMTVDQDQFRLTDTDGVDAPKARSWKSGFLKKGSAPVELIEFSDAPMLRKYVGHRVVATGRLSGRQLHVRSIQGGGSSCN